MELARIRHARARERAASTGDRLSASDAAQILDLLENARRHRPPLAEVYKLMAEVWVRSAMDPTPAQIAVLNEGVRLFPRDSALVMAAIHFNAMAGQVDAVMTFVALGLRYAGNASMRDRFTRLSEAIRVKWHAGRTSEASIKRLLKGDPGRPARLRALSRALTYD